MKTTNVRPLCLGIGCLLALAAVTEELHVGAFAATNSLVLIPQTNWTLLFVDSQELSGPAQNGCCDPTPATNAFDGNPSTFWNTEWVTVQPGFPHEIQIDLGATYSIAGFRHLPRQDGLNNGRIKQYEFFVSSDGVNWGTAVASDAFPDTDQPTDVIFAGGPVNGRYIRLVAHSNYSADGFSASLAELNVWADNGSPTPTPTATATATPQPTATPAPSSTPTPTVTPTASPTPTPTPITTIIKQPADQTVMVGQSATFTVTATGSGPLSYKWRRNGQPISGKAANGPAYKTPPTTMADNGAKFSCMVSSGGGTVTSNNATLTVTAATPTPTPSPTTTPTPTATPTGAPPTIRKVTANPAILWPPNHTMRPVTITVDAIASNGSTPTCTIVGVTSNEKLGPNDVVITGNLSVQLRADRAGKNKAGRIYTITIRCTDSLGNSSEKTVTVTVPHSNGKPRKPKR